MASWFVPCLTGYSAACVAAAVYHVWLACVYHVWQVGVRQAGMCHLLQDGSIMYGKLVCVLYMEGWCTAGERQIDRY